MKGKYLIIAFLASWTVITASKLPDIFEEQCPPGTSCPPVLIPHKDCDKFYECHNGQKVTITCASGLYFSKQWGGCVDLESSDCANPLECKFEGELLPHECKCAKYYLCKGKGKALRDCDPGTHFDTVTRNGCVPGKCVDPSF